jgi:hypothetical protein
VRDEAVTNLDVLTGDFADECAFPSARHAHYGNDHVIGAATVSVSSLKLLFLCSRTLA